MERLPPELLFEILAQLELSDFAALYSVCGDQGYAPLITLMATRILKNLVTSAPPRFISAVDSVGLPCKSEYFKPDPPLNDDFELPLNVAELANQYCHRAAPNIFSFHLHHKDVRRRSSPNGMSIGESSNPTSSLSLNSFHLCFHGVAPLEMIATELVVQDQRDSEGLVPNKLMVGYSTLNLSIQSRPARRWLLCPHTLSSNASFVLEAAYLQHETVDLG
jgi:hypothetical protein